MKKQSTGVAVALTAWAVLSVGNAVRAEVALPNGYEKIGYVETTGRQWIDTGYRVRPDTRIDCEVRVPANQQRTAYLALFGACDGGTCHSALQAWARFNGRDLPALDAGGKLLADNRSIYFPYGAKVRVSYADGQLTWDDGDERWSLYSAGAPQASKNTLMVFDTDTGRNGVSRAEGNRGWMRLYWFRISDGDGLRRDFTPCRDQQGVAGLWDAVEGRFYASAGPANFLGADPFEGFVAADSDERTVVVGPDFYGFTLPYGVPLAARGTPYGARFEKDRVDILDARWYNNQRIVGSVKELRWRESVAKRRRAEFDAFMKGIPAAPAGFEYSRQLAGYILWSCVMKPEGNFRREAVLMSKRFMTNVWSWDHMFNALALADAQPKLAWDQFAVMFDHQDARGYIPDGIGANNRMLGISKPPIHGWAFRKMMQRMKMTDAQLAQAYVWLSKWTNWWRTDRLDKASGLSFYTCGCDSGWDNSTAFMKPSPVILPDLQAFLVLQMEVLGELAQKLGKDAEAKRWQEQSDDLLKRMFAYDYGKWSDSLIYHVTVILGHRLPPEQRARYVEPLRDTKRFLTEWGLATEALNSKYHAKDGYWRGPIWAPYTLLMVDGLRDMGGKEKAFGDDLARRFMRLFRKGGSAENYDPITGKGLRDLAYTWTSSVFLEFLRDVR